jgi:hypothetical protein
VPSDEGDVDQPVHGTGRRSQRRPDPAKPSWKEPCAYSDLERSACQAGGAFVFPAHRLRPHRRDRAPAAPAGSARGGALAVPRAPGPGAVQLRGVAPGLAPRRPHDATRRLPRAPRRRGSRGVVPVPRRRARLRLQEARARLRRARGAVPRPRPRRPSGRDRHAGPGDPGPLGVPRELPPAARLLERLRDRHPRLRLHRRGPADRDRGGGRGGSPRRGGRRGARRRHPERRAWRRLRDAPRAPARPGRCDPGRRAPARLQPAAGPRRGPRGGRSPARRRGAVAGRDHPAARGEPGERARGARCRAAGGRAAALPIFPPGGDNPDRGLLPRWGENGERDRSPRGVRLSPGIPDQEETGGRRRRPGGHLRRLPSLGRQGGPPSVPQGPGERPGPLGGRAERARRRAGSPARAAGARRRRSRSGAREAPRDQERRAGRALLSRARGMGARRGRRSAPAAPRDAHGR